MVQFFEADQLHVHELRSTIRRIGQGGFGARLDVIHELPLRRSINFFMEKVTHMKYLYD